MLKDFLRPNLRIRITEFYKISIVSITANTVVLKSDAFVTVQPNTVLTFVNGAILLTQESLIPDWSTGSVEHPYTLKSGIAPQAGHCTSFNDPVTGSLKQFDQVTVLEAAVRRIKEPVPESLAGVDHNALRLRGRLLTPYDKPLKPGLYDAETEFSYNQKSVGKFLIENNISDSLEGHEKILGTKISGWFQSYLVRQ